MNTTGPNSTEPLVTAIIPTVGRLSLKRAVGSALRQTEPTVPLVVLDDPDAAGEVRRRLDGMPHRLISTEGREGGARARNLGVLAADTPYVAFLDDDDEWVAQKSESQLPHAQQGAVVSSRSLLIGEMSRVVPEQLYSSASGSAAADATSEKPGGAVADYVLDRSTLRLRRRFMQTSSLMCSRDWALSVPWDEALPRHQDWDWLMRVEAEGAELRSLPDILVRVFQDSSGSVSRRPDWRASIDWIDSLPVPVSSRARADFNASVVARNAFEAGNWGAGVRKLWGAVFSGAHPAALMVGISGATHSRWRHA
ncbi:MAG: glycosyltransferase family 2 protein [Nesterenkonia sp.]|uniref:glycosyltransferase family 2 protein n=1 Tax=Nesterenkonia marinintestina TaxID=2979865 RepID=UPI0021BE2027|nr:glycosyltransferase family 2 protein [Nesterenkonia sp. GX14115]MDO5492513.1 glycosyltransferase family 2 protein [Nesterenkonia sp.]